MLGFIITFLGGVLLSGLIGLVVWVSSIRKNQNKLSESTKVDLQDLNKRHNELISMIRMVEEEVKTLKFDVHQYVDTIYRETDNRFENVDKSIDSRLDKLENRLTKINEDGCEPVKKQLNG